MLKHAKRFEMRADDALFDRIDEWRAAQRPIPSRVEAVRLLCTLALDAETKEN